MDQATQEVLRDLILDRPWDPEEETPGNRRTSKEPVCADCRHLNTGTCRKHHIEVHPEWPACDTFSPTPE